MKGNGSAQSARFLADRDATRTEADVQAAIRDLLIHGGIDLGGHHVRLESPAPNRRRIDIEVGHAVIEVKRDLRSVDFEEALRQLVRYQADRQQQRGARHVGLLTDGRAWNAYLLDPDGQPAQLADFHLEHADQAERLLVWLEAMLATRQRIPAGPQEIEERLGQQSSSYQADLVELGWLYDAVADHQDVALKRQLWAVLLHVAFGTAVDQEAVDTRELFLDHTYLVVLATLIGYEVVGVSVTGQRPVDLLSGRLFRQAGIHGVVEQDFFDWVADSPAGSAWVERLARKIARFDWSRVDHDVLKMLYESVIDADTRHRLGEYYTPDWLAVRIVDEIVDDPAHQRILDPACGSGTFVFHAVRASLRALKVDHGTSNADAIDSTCRRIFGMDVHPVAVTLARITYLLAIGPDRLQSRGSFSVPVFLGDSMRYETTAEYEQTLLSSAAGTGLVVHLITHDDEDDLPQGLTFPESVLDDVVNFDRFVDELTLAAKQRAGGAVPDITALLNRYDVPESDRPLVRETLRTLCELVDADRNHVWGYYTRNLARPYWFAQSDNQVDRLVGNVPWLSYRFMPFSVGNAFRDLAEKRGLWVGGKQATHQDLSALFVARSIEQYLDYDGRFGFLVPRALLTGDSYSRFRTGVWTEGRGDSPTTTVQFDKAWDLDPVQDLFPVPAAAILGERVRNADGPLPIPAETTVLSRAVDGTLRVDSGSTAATHELALDEPSVYAEEFRQGATIVPTVLTRVQPQPSGPLGLPDDAVRVTSARSRYEKAPWRTLDSLDAPVPERFLFRLYVSETVLPFVVRQPGWTLLPFDPQRGQLLRDQELDQWPAMASWWRRAERLYDDNRADNAVESLRERVNYNGALDAQGVLTTLRVVYAAAGSHAAAAITRATRSIVESGLYWRAVHTEDEGHYLCGILNAPFTAESIRHLQSRGLFGPRHFHKRLLQLPWPAYDPTDPSHAMVVGTARDCRDVAAGVDGIADGHFVTVRRRIRKALEEQGLLDQLNEQVAGLIGHRLA